MPGLYNGPQGPYVPPEHERRLLYCTSPVCDGETSWVGMLAEPECWACGSREHTTWKAPKNRVY